MFKTFVSLPSGPASYYGKNQNFLFRGLTVIVVLGLTVDDSRSHSNTRDSTGYIRTSDRPEAERSVPDITHTTQRDRGPGARSDSKPQSPRSERPQTHATDHTATGVGVNRTTRRKQFSRFNFSSKTEIHICTLYVSPVPEAARPRA